MAGRSIQVFGDVAFEELLYMFERVRILKRKSGRAIEDDSEAPPLAKVVDAGVDERLGELDRIDSCVYLMFMDGSTRTRESIRNAARYHQVKVCEFSAETSSFQKNETFQDTMKMLINYSIKRTVVVIRARVEGVCRMLESSMSRHAQRFNLPQPVFLNAGDGSFAHPLLEFNDVFSFLEHLRFDRSTIRLALVGDLKHSRAAYSKADGLKLFDDVHVDLVAPDLFAYPVEYKERMRRNGFNIREFSSIEEYVASAGDSMATIWYFHQPQFKKCGDLSPERADELRSMMSFKVDWESKLPANAIFMQTLPRDCAKPLVPVCYDTSALNGWERVASNAYYVNIVLLGLLMGSIGEGLPQPVPEPLDEYQTPVCPLGPGNTEALPDFIQVVDVSAGHERQLDKAASGGTVPLSDGLVLDHICTSGNPGAVWKRLDMVRTLMGGWSDLSGSEGVYKSNKSEQYKGIMSFPNFVLESLTVPQLKVLASVSPGCTVNAVRGSKVVSKYRLSVPLRIYDMPNLGCKNELCISHPLNKQRDVKAFFGRVPFYRTSCLPDCTSAEFLFVCKYCEWPHEFKDIWADAAFRHQLSL